MLIVKMTIFKDRFCHLIEFVFRGEQYHDLFDGHQTNLNIDFMKTNDFILCISLLLFCFCACTHRKEQGLKDVADFPVGTAVSIQSLIKDVELQTIQNRNFNSLTSGSDMKMNRIVEQDENYNWSTVDQFVDYAENHGQRVFGHNLIWHSSTPEWVIKKGSEDHQWMADFMKRYIQTYVGRYKGRVDAWDVVNEGLVTKGGELRQTIWLEALGASYIAQAFEYAHEADPEATLFYNDFNIERDTVKLTAMLDMIEEFQSTGVPISGIGFQMHIRMDIPNSLIRSSLEKAAATGLQIHLSELDIIFNYHDDTYQGGVQVVHELTDEMRMAQAQKYKEIVEIYREVVPLKQQYGITFWGFNDRDSWICGFFNLKDWPCIYDDDLKPKPAYWGFKDGLQSELN